MSTGPQGTPQYQQVCSPPPSLPLLTYAASQPGQAEAEFMTGVPKGLTWQPGNTEVTRTDDIYLLEIDNKYLGNT